MESVPTLVAPNGQAGLVDAAARGKQVRYEAAHDSLGYWRTEGDYVEWEVEASQAARYEVRAVVACQQGEHGGRFEVRVGGQVTLSATVPSTGSWKTYQELSVGAVRLEPGVHRISVHNRKALGPLMKLRGLRLVAQ